MRASTLLTFASMAVTAFAATVTVPLPASKVARADKLKGVQPPSDIPIPEQLRSQGCYSSYGNMTAQKGVENVTSGSCWKWCVAREFSTMALNGGTCFCGKFYPPEDTMVDDKKCNYPCPYWEEEACGGISKPLSYSVFNTGRDIYAEHMPSEKDDEEKDDSDKKDDKKDDTVSTSASSPASAPTAAASDPSKATETSTDNGDSGSGPNVAGIAAGVVVGVVVIGAAIGGMFFFIRRRRNAEIEEEHRRNAAVNAFINGSKPPSTSGSVTMTDSRLEPVMAQRRLSDGSIADNQDYSRRILRVTNA